MCAESSQGHHSEQKSANSDHEPAKVASRTTRLFHLGKLPFNRVVGKETAGSKTVVAENGDNYKNARAAELVTRSYRNWYRARTFIRSGELSQMNFDGGES